MRIVVLFDSHLEEINEEAHRKIVDWLEAIGQDAASTARNYAPHRTGALRNSLASQVNPSAHEVYVGTNIPYAIYQELGTSRIAGKHFLQFGATAHTAEYQALLKQALEN